MSRSFESSSTICCSHCSHHDGGTTYRPESRWSSSSNGYHLRPANDFLIAAIAEAAEDGDVILWFLDKDMRIICEQTGQAYEAES